MKRLRRALILVALAGGGSALGQRELASAVAVQLPDPWWRTGVIAKDVDGDGLRDLVIATRERGGRRRRSLRVHVQRASGATFAQTPDHELELPRDVGAFAVADVHPDAGAEIVLFNSATAVAWRTGAKGRDRFVKLLDCHFLWQLPDVGRVMAYGAGVRDVDGDGLDDLLIPEPDGFRLALQDRGEGGAKFERIMRLTVPPDPPSADPEDDGDETQVRRPGSFRLSLPVGGPGPDGAVAKPPLLAQVERAPRPNLLDFDADRKLDVIARTAARVHVWRQGGGGRFAESPDASFDAPVVADRARAVDVSYGTHFLDLDRDHRSDCVIFAGDQRADEAQTQALVFVQGQGRGATAQTKESPLFGERGWPQRLLKIAGFTGEPHFTDVDGDGLPDLAIGALRPDLIDELRGKGSETVDTELYVFLNRKGMLSRQPDLRFDVRLKIEGMGSLRQGFLARFIGDITRDRVSELMVRDRPDRLRLYLTRKQRDGLTVLDRPIWERRVDEDAELELLGGDTPSLIIREPRQVVYVRFR